MTLPGGGFDLNGSQGRVASWAGRPSGRERKVWQRGCSRGGALRGAPGEDDSVSGWGVGGEGKAVPAHPPPREALPFSREHGSENHLEKKVSSVTSGLAKHKRGGTGHAPAPACRGPAGAPAPGSAPGSCWVKRATRRAG